MWKSRILLRLVAGLALSRSLFVFAEQQAPRPPHRVKVEKNVRIPMRDGVTLAADFYRPDADGRFPALVQLSYYITGPAQAEFFAPHGYVCVLANSRGRGGSEGDWDPYVNEPRDGFDLQQWVGQQPWCSGQVGMFGQSYNAFTQTMSAPLASPYLKCIVPVESGSAYSSTTWVAWPVRI